MPNNLATLGAIQVEGWSGKGDRMGRPRVSEGQVAAEALKSVGDRNLEAAVPCCPKASTLGPPPHLLRIGVDQIVRQPGFLKLDHNDVFST